MAVIKREFVSDDTSVTVEIDKDADRVTVDTASHDPVTVDVEGDTAIIDDPVPNWAEKPLAQVGVRSYEYE